MQALRTQLARAARQAGVRRFATDAVGEFEREVQHAAKETSK